MPALPTRSRAPSRTVRRCTVVVAAVACTVLVASVSRWRSREVGGLSARHDAEQGWADEQATETSCERMGCSEAFHPHLTCQCNKHCAAHHNCCFDYRRVCEVRERARPVFRSTSTTTLTTTTLTRGRRGSFCEESIGAEGLQPWEYRLTTVQVVSEKRENATVLGERVGCDTFAGRREGNWVRLLCEPGYVQIISRFGEQVRPIDVSFIRLAEGLACHDQSLVEIDSQGVCDAAGASLGLLGGLGTAIAVVDNSGPGGCYWDEVSSGQWRLVMVFNTQPPTSRHGSGKVICSSARERCIATAPTTSTGTTTTLTTTSSTSTKTSSTSTVTSTTTSTTTVTTTTLSSTTSTTSSETGTSTTATSTSTTRTGTSTTATLTSSTTTTTTFVAAASVRMFCFTIITDQGSDLRLLAALRDRRASVFGCDSSFVMSVGGVFRFGDLLTAEIAEEPDAGSVVGKRSRPLLLRAWDTVVQSGQLHLHDWVVKVELDTVFFPDRLRARLLPLTPSVGSKRIFLATYPPVQGIGSLGGKLQRPLVVLSRATVKLYAQGAVSCRSVLKRLAATDEDYLEACVRHLGASELDGAGLTAGPASCADQSPASFSGLDGVGSYMMCFREAVELDVWFGVTRFSARTAIVVLRCRWEGGRRFSTHRRMPSRSRCPTLVKNGLIFDDLPEDGEATMVAPAL
mmetsp:Transcript_124157/g.359048  ORF Transcript_124157/g.359048 Transcript_124157/m.359048 type:complete len:686 (-) Transcript_124157:129-2186(-)